MNWISVLDQMPDQSDMYLTYAKGQFGLDNFDKEKGIFWEQGSWMGKTVAHVEYWAFLIPPTEEILPDRECSECKQMVEGNKVNCFPQKYKVYSNYICNSCWVKMMQSPDKGKKRYIELIAIMEETLKNKDKNEQI